MKSVISAVSRKFVQSALHGLSFLPVFASLLIFAVLGLTACGDRNASDQPPAVPSPSTGLSSSHPPGSGTEKVFGPLKMRPPAGWIEKTPTSSMRKGQFSLPRVEGDPADGELIVFYFGPGQGGSTDANIDRWIGQITQADGSSSKARAKTSKKNIAGMPVTLVDVTGVYQPLRMPGAEQQRPNNGYRMVAAVVETSEGPWFFKLVGPEKTVARWSESFDQFLSSIGKS